MKNESINSQNPYVKKSYAWYMVLLMTMAYMFSFIDRYILGLLIDPIKADLGLSDTQMGLLLGPAFAIFYATMGLPLGYLADRVKRVSIVSIGIFIWSLATVASGFAVMVCNPIVITRRFLEISMPPKSVAAAACVSKLVAINRVVEL